MGRDKAMLPVGRSTLVEQIAGAVAAAAGSVTLVGNPWKYGDLGYPVLADVIDGAGPLAAIVTALGASRSDWNLVVACDMPEIAAPFLEELLDAAESAGAACLLPVGPSGLPEPLCAAYHRDALPHLREELDRGVRKLQEALAGLHTTAWRTERARFFRNLNTPEDWNEYLKINKTREPRI